MRSLWLVPTLLACVGDASPPDDADTDADATVDTDADGDTDRDTGVGVHTDLAFADLAVRRTRVPCADPGRRADAPWDVALGLREPLPRAQRTLIGGGGVIADLNGDGGLDVFLPGGARSELRVQEASGALPIATERFGDVDLTYATGATAVDVDADGDLDLYVTRWLLPNVLLVNDGTGTFTDGTAAAGLATEGRRSQASAWGDMDRDGDLDLVVGVYGERPPGAHRPDEYTDGDPSWLFENLGDGTFVDRSDLLPPDVQAAHTFQVAWQDVNLDGHPELLFVNDFGWFHRPLLFWNTDEGLVPDLDDETGFRIPFAGMGLGIGDLNGDGRPDFVQSSWKDMSALVSTGTGWFDDVHALGLWPVWDDDTLEQVFGWGVEVADVDLDGHEDVLVAFGDWADWGSPDWQVDGLWLHVGGGVYEDQAAAWGFDHSTTSRGLVVADVNGDGWPDVLKRGLDQPARLFLSRCGDGAWLRFRTRAPAPNTHAIGARVVVTVGTRQWTRWVRAGGTSMYAGGPPEVLFGLAGAPHADRVDIYWPDGRHHTLTDLPTNQLVELTLREP